MPAQQRNHHTSFEHLFFAVLPAINLTAPAIFILQFSPLQSHLTYKILLRACDWLKHLIRGWTFNSWHASWHTLFTHVLFYLVTIILSTISFHFDDKHIHVQWCVCPDNFVVISCEIISGISIKHAACYYMPLLSQMPRTYTIVFLFFCSKIQHNAAHVSQSKAFPITLHKWCCFYPSAVWYKHPTQGIYDSVNIPWTKKQNYITNFICNFYKTVIDYCMFIKRHLT